jgi:uncharacterized membrane protein
MNMNVGPAFAFSVVIYSTLGIVGLLLFLLPGLTRPDVYFAVTVQQGFRETPEGRDIQGRYRLEIVIHTLVACALVLAGLCVKIPAAFLAGILWQMLGFFSAFLGARKKATPHAVQRSMVREAELGPALARPPGGWLLQSAPFVALTATGIWLHLHWGRIPEKFPVHWGLNGRPNGWASRSITGVYNPLALGVAVCAGLLLLTYGIAAFSRRIRVGGAAGERELRFRRVMLCIMLGAEFFIAFLLSWVSLFALRTGQAMPNTAVVMLGNLALVAAITLVLIRTGQGGTRLARSSPSEDTRFVETSPIGDRTLDSHWKAGVFYVNSDDPARMVEARLGIGYTLNLGRPLAWVILVLLVGVPLALAFLMPHLK